MAQALRDVRRDVPTALGFAVLLWALALYDVVGREVGAVAAVWALVVTGTMPTWAAQLWRLVDWLRLCDRRGCFCGVCVAVGGGAAGGAAVARRYSSRRSSNGARSSRSGDVERGMKDDDEGNADGDDAAAAAMEMTQVSLTANDAHDAVVRVAVDGCDCDV